MPEESNVGSASESSEGGFDGDLGVGTESAPAQDTSPQDTPDGAVEPGQEGGELEPIRDFDDVALAALGEQAPEPEPQPQKVKFAGREYDTLEAAEQAFKSFEGRIRASEQQKAIAEKLNREWQLWYQGQQQSESRGEPSQALPKSLLDAVNWKNVEETGQKEGFIPALQEAIADIAEFYDRRLQGFEAQYGRPVAEMQERAQHEAQARELIYSQAMSVDQEGNPYYPELYEGGTEFDQNVARDVIETWKLLAQENLGFALTPTGFHSAVSMVRSNRARQPRGQAQQNAPQVARVKAGEVGRDAQGRFMKQQRARNNASLTGDGAPHPSAGTPGPAGSVSEAQFKRSIKNAGQRDPFLGVWK